MNFIVDRAVLAFVTVISLVSLCAFLAAVLPNSAATIIPTIMTAILGIVSSVFLYNSHPLAPASILPGPADSKKEP